MMQIVDNLELRKEIKIQNVVCTADLKQRVDIKSFNNYKYLRTNMSLYPCGYFKDDSMVGQVTVFSTGKLISVGTKSVKQAFFELQRTGTILKKYGLIRSFKITPKVINVVARFNLERKMPLEILARVMPKAMYEPDQFPALIFRILNSRVALIFASGKGMLLGAKSIAELNEGLYTIEQWTDQRSYLNRNKFVKE